MTAAAEKKVEEYREMLDVEGAEDTLAAILRGHDREDVADIIADLSDVAMARTEICDTYDAEGNQGRILGVRKKNMTTEELEMCVGAEVAANAMRKAQYHHEYMCPKCHGSGIHWTRRGDDRDCWYCDGTGTLTAPRIDRVYYRSLLFAARRGEDINEYGRIKNTSSDLVRETREEHGMNDTTSRSPDGFFRGVCGAGYTRRGSV